MKKWEEEYNKFKNGDKDKEIEELQEKFSNKTINKEEYDLLQKNLKIKANISKVENILEYKEKLNKELLKIKQEQENRKLINDIIKQKEEIEKEKSKLEEQMKVYQNRLKGIKEELKVKGITEERKSELEIQKAECINEINRNNELYIENGQKMQKLEVSENEKKNNKNKFTNLPDDILNKKTTELSTKISKCNMIVNNLMKGASWDTIELKLDNWKDKKFTRKVDDKKILDYKKEEKPVKEKEAEEKETEGKTDEEKEDKNKFMMIVSAFAAKHPRLARIGRSIRDGFVGLVQRIKNAGNEEEIIEEESIDVKPAEEKPIEEKVVEEKTNKDNEFRKYIRDIAENGMKKADQNRLKEFRENRNKSKESNEHEADER